MRSKSKENIARICKERMHGDYKVGATFNTCFKKLGVVLIKGKAANHLPAPHTHTHVRV